MLLCVSVLILEHMKQNLTDHGDNGITLPMMTVAPNHKSLLLGATSGPLLQAQMNSTTLIDASNHKPYRNTNLTQLHVINTFNILRLEKVKNS